MSGPAVSEDVAVLSLAEVIRDEARLLKSMGWEAGNIHLGTRGAARAIVIDLARRKQGWLRDAATRMARRLPAA